MRVNKQSIVDLIENAISGRVPSAVEEKILNHVWDILCDELGMEDGEDD